MSKLALFILDDKKQRIIVPLLSVILGFLVGAIILLASGFNPIVTYKELFIGAFAKPERFGNTLLNMTTLMLTGLSIAFAFRTGLFNIGAPGQMLMGGFAGVFIGVTMDLPRIIHLPLAVLSATLMGALWAIIPALLKAKYRIHEVVTTIMMNWIAVWSVYYFVPKYIKGGFDTESAVIKKSASLRVDWLSNLFDSSKINLGLFVAIFALVVVWFILEKTTFGYELKAVGFNQNAAKYAGIKVNANIIYSMMISGALAGLAGATYYLGYSDNIKIGVLPSLGFEGIAVALLGLNSPIGILFSSFLFGFMSCGKGYMAAKVLVPNELVPIIIAVIIFFAATSLMIKNWLNKLAKRFVKETSVIVSQGGDK